MSEVTERGEYPYPEDGDAPNGPAQIKALADRLEAVTPLTGYVTAAGGILHGTGFTVEKVATGNYKIVFTKEMPSEVITVATPFGASGGRTATVSDAFNKKETHVRTSESGVAADLNFFFIAMPAL